MKLCTQVGRLFGLALLVTGLVGCGCRNDPPQAAAPAVQTPTSPMAQVQTPTMPRQEPTRPQTPTSPVRTVPPAVAPPAEEKPAPVLGLAPMRLIKKGMTQEEVADLLGRPGFVMSQTGSETEVYRWTDPDSATLLARFENGKLTRKNIIAADGVELSEQNALSEEDYHSITPGMSIEETLTLIGIEPKSQNEGRDGTSIYRWADTNGSSFTARFQDGKLVRKTGFHVARKEEPAPDEATTVETPEPGPEAPEPDEEMAETPRDAPLAVPEEISTPHIVPPTPEEAPEKRPRVRSTVSNTGDEKRERSYNPKAKLPDFAHGLRQGAFEVRVTNPTHSKVKAGLRLGNRGIDVSIAPRSSRSVKVDRGVYSFYFISDADPYAVNGGGSVDLTSMFASDIEISIINENYEVRLLDGRP